MARCQSITRIYSGSEAPLPPQKKKHCARRCRFNIVTMLYKGFSMTSHQSYKISYFLDIAATLGNINNIMVIDDAFNIRCYFANQ